MAFFRSSQFQLRLKTWLPPLSILAVASWEIGKLLVWSYLEVCISITKRNFLPSSYKSFKRTDNSREGIIVFPICFLHSDRTCNSSLILWFPLWSCSVSKKPNLFCIYLSSQITIIVHGLGLNRLIPVSWIKCWLRPSFLCSAKLYLLQYNKLKNVRFQFLIIRISIFVLFIVYFQFYTSNNNNNNNNNNNLLYY